MDRAAVEDLFAPVLRVGIRRMFGGAGIYDGDVIFALLADGEVFLKTDAESRAAFEASGSRPFSYRKKGADVMITSYWRLPEDAYDDPDRLRHWTGLALAAARRKAKQPDGRQQARATRARRVAALKQS